MSSILISCNYSEKKIKETNNSVVINKKISFKELLKPQNKVSNLVEGNLSNVDSINGFRGLKFNLNINEIDKKTLESDINIYGKNYSLVYETINGSQKINNTRINFVKLEFYKDTLKSILLQLDSYINKEMYVKHNPSLSEDYFDFSNYDLINFYVDSFGNPNEVTICTADFNTTNYGDNLKAAISDFSKIDNLYTPSLYIVWETKKIIYKIDIYGNGGASLIKKESYDFDVNIFIYEKKYQKLLEDAKDEDYKLKKQPVKLIKDL